VHDISTPRPWPTLRGRWDLLLVIAVGGALGSLARWGLGELLPHEPDEIAWNTWLANVSGALPLGVLMVFVSDVWPPTRYVRPFLGVGVLGGFTTFSAYMLDARFLLVEGEPARAAVYVLGTLVSGLLAVWLGIVLARTTVVVARRRPRSIDRTRRSP